MNTFGTLFRVTTWGESHGKALGCVIDGCPSNISIDESDIAEELKRRKPGQSAVTTSRREDDKPEILSGVFEGKTTGHPISVLVWNKDADSSKYDNLKDVYRPGHADLTYEKKYGIRDHRGGGRSSGRETVARVIAGAIAKQVLAKEKVEIVAFARQIGSVVADKMHKDKMKTSLIEQNSVRTADKSKTKEMVDEILKAKKDGDSVGGIIEVVIKNCPVGLGSPVFHKLKADLANAMMSIGAVIGFEYGSGFEGVTKKGSEFNDNLTKKGFSSNNHGGILGGISTGEDIVMRIAVKPTSSIRKKQKTIKKDGSNTTIEIEGRHDPCLVPRIIPVVDNMVALVLVDHLLIAKSYR